MTSIHFQREVSGTVEAIVEKVTKALAAEGFGVLTRIDFDKKMKEKLNKDMRPLVILGACNPSLAYEAFLKNSDVTNLVPCNAVVREIRDGVVSVELVKPTALMKMLGDDQLVTLSEDADRRLEKVIQEL